MQMIWKRLSHVYAVDGAQNAVYACNNEILFSSKDCVKPEHNINFCAKFGCDKSVCMYRLYTEVQVSTLFTQPRAEGPRLCKSRRDRTEVYNGLVPWATWP